LLGCGPTANQIKPKLTSLQTSEEFELIGKYLKAPFGGETLNF